MWFSIAFPDNPALKSKTPFYSQWKILTRCCCCCFCLFYVLPPMRALCVDVEEWLARIKYRFWIKRVKFIPLCYSGHHSKRWFWTKNDHCVRPMRPHVYSDHIKTDTACRILSHWPSPFFGFDYIMYTIYLWCIWTLHHVLFLRYWLAGIVMYVW